MEAARPLSETHMLRPRNIRTRRWLRVCLVAFYATLLIDVAAAVEATDRRPNVLLTWLMILGKVISDHLAARSHTPNVSQRDQR